jgi:hypothetical protein
MNGMRYKGIFVGLIIKLSFRAWLLLLCDAQ